MPDRPNKLSQFWQELKRRKVVRVITVYAAAAFVILEPPVVYNLDLVKKIYAESGFKGVLKYDIEIFIQETNGGNRVTGSIASLYGMIGEDEKALEWLETVMIWVEFHQI